MNEPLPGDPGSSPPLPERKPSRRRFIVWCAFGFIVAAAIGIAAGFWILRIMDSRDKGAAPASAAARPEDSWLNAKDFSTSNSVSIVLGEQESGNGLEHIDTERDGLTVIATAKGRRCRGLNLPLRSPSGDPNGYFYFFIDPSFKQQESNSVRIEIEYYNEKRGTLAVQYDARVRDRSQHSIYTRPSPAIALDGSKEWETAIFHIRDGAFEGSQNGGSDFRLRVSPPQLYVRRVTITREQSE